MATAVVTFRLSEEDKLAMEEVCQEIGISPSCAYQIYARKIGRERRIPFMLEAISAKNQGIECFYQPPLSKDGCPILPADWDDAEDAIYDELYR